MVFEKIKNIIVEQLNIEEEGLTLETSFEELGVDSLDLFQIVIEIEEEFNLQIEDAESIKTIGDAVKFVENNIEE
ncbi:acyl carrier protein [Clostridium sp. HMP27]|uniref:acyl carrier protein n=1 Tax=Clostridium sp. HMP27 TaxID=1487921 RepID=UPI00052CB196|nr:acyl carrier protein [Clostridium sp. HMP27]KGK89179.1 acyl carrier protein [Clostridium sp. HMP27]MBE6067328.1 acyl carrier protein [Clostridium lundense]